MEEEDSKDHPGFHTVEIIPLPEKKGEDSGETERNGVDITCEIEIEKTFDYQKTYACFLHLGDPHHLFFIAGYHQEIKTTSIYIFDSRTNEQISMIGIKSSYGQCMNIKEIIQWDDDSILTCGHFDIDCFSLKRPKFQHLKRISCLKEKAIRGTERILKLTNDLFAVKSSGHVRIISLEKGEAVKSYFVGYMAFWNGQKLIKSKKFNNCFYVNVNDEFENVKLIDYEKDMVVKEFHRPVDNSKHFITYDVYQSSKGKEILICFDDARTIYSFDTSESTYNRKINIRPLKTGGKFKGYKRADDKINCSSIIGNQYITCGDRSGDIHIYEIFERDDGDDEDNDIFTSKKKTIIQLKKLAKKRVHSRYCFDVRPFCFGSPDNIRILTSCSQKDAHVLRIKGLRLDRGQVVEYYQWKDDTLQRICFLMESRECFIEDRSILIGIKLPCFDSPFFLFKSFF